MSDSHNNTPTANVLIIHTGGTLGMASSDRGWVPKSGHLEFLLRNNTLFNGTGGVSPTTPTTSMGKRIDYTIIENKPLLDSSNVTPEHWRVLATQIVDNYDDYDGFVVLHGTDTMAYTASALSFMLKDLTKPVIFTGSQIPLARMRSDATNNLLGALTIAAHYPIPEVGIFFFNRLLRGNRTQKLDASGLRAFRSGNLPSLVTVGVEYTVHWPTILPMPAGTGPTLRNKFSPDVAVIRLVPGISTTNLHNAMLAPIRGVILETFGSGNAPDNQAAFTQVLKTAVERGVVIVNCTQCHRGRVNSDYAAGTALEALGIITAGDMTLESAYSKLSLLLGEGLSAEEIRIEMIRNIAGELTPEPEALRPPTLMKI